MSEFEDLIPEFVEESLEHLKNIEEDIIQIEQGNAGNELINSVFRAVHSVKGGSSFLGLKNIEKLSHKMEDIFNLVRNGNMEFSSSISSKVLNSIDKLKEMLENPEDSESIDISSNVKDMEFILTKKSSVSVDENISVSALDSQIEISKYKFDSYRKNGMNVFLIRMELQEKGKYKNVLDFLKEIGKIGEIIESAVDFEFVMTSENFSGDGIPLKVIYASVLDVELVAHSFGISTDDIILLKEDSVQFHKEPPAEPVVAEPAPVVEEKAVESPAEPPAKTAEPEIEPEAEEEEEDIEMLADDNEFMTFLIGEEEYGIGIKLIQEIVTMQSITEVPDSKVYTKGVINLRGDIIPVYDFRLRLDFDEREYDSETIILVINIGEKKMGLIVDRISEVIQLKGDQITDAPQMKNIDAQHILGIGQKEGKFIVLLRIRDMFNEEEVA